MTFGTNFVSQPDRMRRVCWFVPTNKEEAPDDVDAHLLSDVFDLALKFGLVVEDGRARLLEFSTSEGAVSVVSHMPHEGGGLGLSLKLLEPASGVYVMTEFHVVGREGVPGIVGWDARLAPATVWALIRGVDAAMDAYGCLSPRNGERLDVFGANGNENPRINVPVDMYFGARGMFVRLPAGTPPDVVIRRFEPKGTLVALTIAGVCHICRSRDVAYIQRSFEERHRATVAVYRKYRLDPYSDDEGDGPDQLTAFRMRIEIDRRHARAMAAWEKRTKKGRASRP